MKYANKDVLALATILDTFPACKRCFKKTIDYLEYPTYNVINTGCSLDAS